MKRIILDSILLECNTYMIVVRAAHAGTITSDNVICPPDGLGLETGFFIDLHEFENWYNHNKHQLEIVENWIGDILAEHYIEL